MQFVIKSFQIFLIVLHNTSYNTNHCTVHDHGALPYNTLKEEETGFTRLDVRKV